MFKINNLKDFMKKNKEVLGSFKIKENKNRINLENEEEYLLNSPYNSEKVVVSNKKQSIREATQEDFQNMPIIDIYSLKYLKKAELILDNPDRGIKTKVSKINNNLYKVSFIFPYIKNDEIKFYTPISLYCEKNKGFYTNKKSKNFKISLIFLNQFINKIPFLKKNDFYQYLNFAYGFKELIDLNNINHAYFALKNVDFQFKEWINFNKTYRSFCLNENKEIMNFNYFLTKYDVSKELLEKIERICKKYDIYHGKIKDFIKTIPTIKELGYSEILEAEDECFYHFFISISPLKAPIMKNKLKEYLSISFPIYKKYNMVLIYDYFYNYPKEEILKLNGFDIFDHKKMISFFAKKEKKVNNNDIINIAKYYYKKDFAFVLNILEQGNLSIDDEQYLERLYINTNKDANAIDIFRQIIKDMYNTVSNFSSEYYISEGDLTYMIDKISITDSEIKYLINGYNIYFNEHFNVSDNFKQEWLFKLIVETIKLYYTLYTNKDVFTNISFYEMSNNILYNMYFDFKVEKEKGLALNMPFLYNCMKDIYYIKSINNLIENILLEKEDIKQNKIHCLYNHRNYLSLIIEE